MAAALLPEGCPQQGVSAQGPHVSSLGYYHSALQDLLARNFSLIILGKASRTDGMLPGHDLRSSAAGHHARPVPTAAAAPLPCNLTRSCGSC